MRKRGAHMIYLRLSSVLVEPTLFPERLHPRQWDP